MLKLVVERSFVIALSLLVACSGEAPLEDFTELEQALNDPPPLPTTPSFPPVLPVPQTLAWNVFPTSIALDDENVYYTDRYALTAEVASRPLAGGAKTVLHTTYTTPSSIVRFGSTVYWVDFTANLADAGVWSAPTNGGAAVKLVPHQNSMTSHRALATFSSGSGFFPVTHILYADAWASKVFDIRRALLGTTVVSLVPDAVPNYYPFSLAIDETHIYFTRDLGGPIRRVPLAGGVPSQFVTEGLERDHLVVADGQVYFVTDDGDIKSKPTGGGATTTFASNVGTIASMVAANGYLYWACSSCNNIKKKPLAGGSTTLLASGHQNLRSLAVDATHIYFGTTTTLKRAQH